MIFLLYWITGNLPCRIISDKGTPYLERYYLFTVFGVRFYLHRFVGSDPDRGVHDHPWPWAFSVILAGWYYEERRHGTRVIRWFNWLTGDTFHRVLLPHDRGVHEVWTIFAHRAIDVKPWGFMRDKGQLGTVFETHSYPGEKKSEWWKSAPIGKISERQLRRKS